MAAILRGIEGGCAWFGRLAAWTVPLLVAGVCVGVLMAQLRISELAHWGVDLPVLGDRLTLNGLNDLQWHLHDLWPELKLPVSALFSKKWSTKISRRLAAAEQTSLVRCSYSVSINVANRFAALRSIGDSRGMPDRITVWKRQAIAQ